MVITLCTRVALCRSTPLCARPPRPSYRPWAATLCSSQGPHGASWGDLPPPADPSEELRTTGCAPPQQRVRFRSQFTRKREQCKAVRRPVLRLLTVPRRGSPVQPLKQQPGKLTITMKLSIIQIIRRATACTRARSQRAQSRDGCKATHTPPRRPAALRRLAGRSKVLGPTHCEEGEWRAALMSGGLLHEWRRASARPRHAPRAWASPAPVGYVFGTSGPPEVNAARVRVCTRMRPSHAQEASARASNMGWRAPRPTSPRSANSRAAARVRRRSAEVAEGGDGGRRARFQGRQARVSVSGAAGANNQRSALYVV